MKASMYTNRAAVINILCNLRPWCNQNNLFKILCHQVNRGVSSRSMIHIKEKSSSASEWRVDIRNCIKSQIFPSRKGRWWANGRTGCTDYHIWTVFTHNRGVYNLAKSNLNTIEIS